MISDPLNRNRIEMAKDQLLHTINQIEENGQEPTKEDWAHIFEDTTVTIVGLTREEFGTAAKELLAMMEALPDGLIGWRLVPRQGS